MTSFSVCAAAWDAFAVDLGRVRTVTSFLSLFLSLSLGVTVAAAVVAELDVAAAAGGFAGAAVGRVGGWEAGCAGVIALLETSALVC